MTGGHTHLNTEEEKVDDIFMEYKLGELAQGFRNAEQNAAALHFFKAKPLIDRSAIFRFLQKMPKGSVLHVHNTASVSSKWVVDDLSYMPGLLRCTTATGQSILSFRRTPKEHKCQSQYVLVSDERRNSLDRQVYDRNFERLINLYTPVPERKSVISFLTRNVMLVLSYSGVPHHYPGLGSIPGHVRRSQRCVNLLASLSSLSLADAGGALQ